MGGVSGRRKKGELHGRGTQGTMCGEIARGEARTIRIPGPLARKDHPKKSIGLLERPATPAHPRVEASKGGGRTCKKRAKHDLARRMLSGGSGKPWAGFGLRERMPGYGVDGRDLRPAIMRADARCGRRRQQQRTACADLYPWGRGRDLYRSCRGNVVLLPDNRLF